MKTNITSAWLSLPLIALAAVAGLYMLYIPNSQTTDILGVTGIALVLSPDTSNPNWPTSSADKKAVLDGCRITMLKRLADLNFSSDPRCIVRKNNKIDVFFPGIKDHLEAKVRITSGDALELYLLTDVQSQINPFGKWRMQGPIHTGEAFTFVSSIGEEINTLKQPQKFLAKVVGAPKIKPFFRTEDFLPNAKAVRNKNKFAVMNIEFNQNSGKRFDVFTKDNIGSILAVVYGGKLLMAPEIREEIPNGKAQISGFANMDEAERMAQMINSGSLAVGFHIESEKTIRPGK